MFIEPSFLTGRKKQIFCGCTTAVFGTHRMYLFDSVYVVALLLLLCKISTCQDSSCNPSCVQGHCEGGVCICNAEFTGNDCSVSFQDALGMFCLESVQSCFNFR